MANTLPDSGKRSEFITGAVRDASEGKGLPSCIPPCALRAMARRFEDGAKKYQRNNWMKGIPLSKYHDSAQRHLLQLAEGDNTEDHAGAVLWNVACWLWTQEAMAAGKLPQELNDLPFHEI